MISDTLHRRLTIVNFVVLSLLALAVLVAALIYREKAVNLVYGYFQREFVASRFIEALLPEESAAARSEARLSRFEIKIKPNDFREIHVLSQRLVDQGVMLDRDKKWFPAKFTHDGREYKVKIRLRGDYSPHWIHVKKSWRIKFKRDDLFNGYRELNLVIPSDRDDENEQVAYELARQAGLLVPDSGFVQVSTNGVDMGAYFWFENNSSEMLEKKQYPEGDIIRSKNIISEKDYYPHGLAAKDFYYVPGSYSNMIRNDATAGYPIERFGQFLRLVRDADESTLKQRLPYYIDMEKFYKWNAIAWMFGSRHAAGIDNLRWYYDTTTGLFEPLLYDVGSRPVGEANTDEWAVVVFDDYYSPIIQGIMAVPEFRRGRNQVLWQMLNDDEFDPIPISRQVFADIKPYLMRGVRSRLGGELEENHEKRIRNLKRSRTYLRDSLAYASVYAYSRLELGDDTPVLSVQVVPDTHNTIALDAIALSFAPAVQVVSEIGAVTLTDDSGHSVPLTGARVSGESQNLNIQFEDLFLSARHGPDGHTLIPTSWRLDIELPGVQAEDWKTPESLISLTYDFYNSVNGESISPEFTHHPKPALGFHSALVSAPFQSVEAFIQKSGLPFVVEGSSLVLDRGTYELHENLIVPVDYGLVLRAGVTLKLAANTSILSYRALHVQGTPDEPVIIQPLIASLPWGAMAIVNAAEESVIEYLHIGGGSDAWINGIFASGQLAFHHSDVRIMGSLIQNAQGDDALNVKKAHASVDNTKFENNTSDAFDSDWVDGIIINSVFQNNGGDGLDTSGSNITVTHSLFSGMGDKGISAGEKTVLRSINNVIRDSNIGVASKDLSQVSVYANVFYNNQVAISLYRKKQVFGGGQAKIVSSLFWRNIDNVSMDDESMLEMIGIGVDKWEDVPRSSVVDLRKGAVGDFYEIDGEGAVVFSGSNTAGSPFSMGPKTEPESVGGLTLPDFSQSPLGLLEPLGAAL
jgi:hypothetical protein